MESDVLNVAGPRGSIRFDVPHIDRMRHGVERSSDKIERIGRPQIRGPSTLCVQMIDRLNLPHLTAELNDAGRPCGHRFYQLLQQPERGLASSEPHGLGHLPSRRQCVVGGQPGGIGRPAADVRRPIANQVADVGHRPVVTRLDKPVFIELRDVALDHINLLGNYAEQSQQRLACLEVPLPVNHRKKIAETVARAVRGTIICCHESTPVSTSVSRRSALRNAIWAGCTRNSTGSMVARLTLMSDAGPASELMAASLAFSELSNLASDVLIESKVVTST